MNQRPSIITVIVVGIVAMWAWGLISHVSHDHHQELVTDVASVDAGQGLDLQGE